MNKENYLHELQNHLKACHVPEQDDIIAEYEEHFRLKMADGYSEEEIAAKLGKPKDIAYQFTTIEPTIGNRKAFKAIIGIGLGFADIFVFMLFIVFYAWVLCLAALSIASLALATVLIFRYDISSIIPYLPYLGALVIGVCSIALAVLSAIGTIYCFLLSNKLIKVYLNWHKRAFSANGFSHPPLPIHPILKDGLRRTIRSIALISIIVLAVTFIGGIFILFAYADFKPFWHAWNWFGGGYIL